jgi:YD repeat-containing protein
MNRILSFFFITIFIIAINNLGYSQDLANASLINQVTNGNYSNFKVQDFSNGFSSISQVDKFRGEINIDIPIVSIKEDGYTFPISLHYSANGLKVDETASEVGLGWQLSVPASIKRSVHGLPDEAPYNGYLSSGMDNLHNMIVTNTLDQVLFDSQYWNSQPSIPSGTNGGALVRSSEDPNIDPQFFELMLISNNINDGLPDEFTYNTGLSSGKFVFSNNGSIIQIPKTTNIIIFNNTTGDWKYSSFEITDRDGIKYIYNINDYENTIRNWSIRGEDQYKSGAFIQSRLNGVNSIQAIEDDYVIEWHLSKIILPNSREINLSYESEEIRYFSSINETYFNSHEQLTNNDGLSQQKVNSSYSTITQHKNRLTSILWSGGKIEFVKSANKRIDMIDPINGYDYNGYALQEIQIYDMNNELKKRYKLYHSYFGTNEQYWGDAGWLKLKLDAVEEISSEGNPNPPYEFSYFETNKHYSKYGVSRDMYGYYKYFPSVSSYINKPNYYIYPDDLSNHLYESIYSMWPRSSFSGTQYHSTNGKDMYPNEDDSKISMLQKITYPTGGYEQFDYESNMFRCDGADRPGPGVRVSSIAKHFLVYGQSDNIVNISYDYTQDGVVTSGLTADFPNMYSFDKGTFKNNPTGSTTAEKYEWSTILSREVKNLKDVQVGYTKVTKSIENLNEPTKNIVSKYHYSFPGDLTKNVDDDNPVLGTYLYKKSKTIMWVLNDFDAEFWPLAETFTFYTSYNIYDRYSGLSMPDYNWNRGDLIMEESYLPEEEIPIQTIEYKYDINDIERLFGIKATDYYTFTIPAGTEIINSNGEWYKSQIDMNYVEFRWGIQYYTSANKYLNKKIITNHFPSGDVVDTYDYQYNTNHLIERIDHGLSNNYIKSQRFKYSNDYLQSTCYEDYLLEVISAYNNYLTDLSVNCYNGTICNDIEVNGGENCEACYETAREAYYLALDQCYQGYMSCIEDVENTTVSDEAKYILKLAVNHQIEVIEKQEILKKNGTDYFLEGEITLYSEFENILRPSLSKSKPISAPIANPSFSYIDNGEFINPGYEDKVSYDSYDLKGNLLQSHYRDNKASQSMVWGYNHQYPIAAANNTTNTQLSDAVNGIQSDVESFLTGLGDLSEQSQRTALASFVTNLQNALPEAMVSVYTYLPLIGMTSETDPSGKTMIYVYDEFGRLETIRDIDNNIIKHVDYHYFESILEATPKSFVIENDGGDFQVDIISNGTWVATENSDFLSLNSPEGTGDGSFQFHCSENTDNIDKPSGITITGSGGVSKTISINQMAADHIIVTLDMVYLPPTGNGSVIVNVKSNIAWTAIYGDGDRFFSFNPVTNTDYETTMNISSNESSNEDMSGEIIISNGNISVTIQVSQDADL